MEATQEIPVKIPEIITPVLPENQTSLALVKPVEVQNPQQLETVRTELNAAINPENKDIIDPKFLLTNATARNELAKNLGRDTNILDPQGNSVLFAHQESLGESMHELRKRIHVYSSEQDPDKALMHITTDKIVDLGSTFDVTDKDNKAIGFLRNRALRTMLIGDKFEILDNEKRLVGNFRQIGVVKSFLDFFGLGMFVNAKYAIENTKGEFVTTMIRNRNPLVVELKRQVHKWDKNIDPRLITACQILMANSP
jgi:hypothetical protein